jgi:ribosomal protein S12 methylthiotransferase
MSSYRIGFVSLGCPKALVDSEKIMTTLTREGYELVDTYEEADLVIINTCGFITDAEEESLGAIGEAIHSHGKVIVTGCLGARPDKIRHHFDQVLAITGPARFEELMVAIHQHLPPPANVRYSRTLGAVYLTPPHYGYLKISEGCSHHCSFCIIPQLRGDQVSRAPAQILAEAERRIEDGAQELIVVAQDTTAYGADWGTGDVLSGKQHDTAPIIQLCHALGDLGVWIRLHYLYPNPVLDELVRLMADGKVLPYLDVPFQHCVPSVLKQMRRPGNQTHLLEAIRRWRSICPEVTLRSTLIVGFPGETEQDFEALLEWVQEARIDRLGAFKYSPVEGAAANAFADPVDESEKEERLERLMQVQEAISRRHLAEKIDRLEPVMIDEVLSRSEYLGRTRGDSPGIDGVVHVESDKLLEPGSIVSVRITQSDEHDLWGRVE